MLSGPQSYMESNSASNWYSFQCNLQCRIQTGVEFCWVTQHLQKQICSTLLCTIYCLNYFAKMLSVPQSNMESNSASNWYSFQCNLLCRIQTGVEFSWLTQHLQKQICSTLLCTIYCLNYFAKMLSGPQSYMESNSASNWWLFQCNLQCRIQPGVEFYWVTQHFQKPILTTLICTIYCLNDFAKMLSGPQSYMESNSASNWYSFQCNLQCRIQLQTSVEFCWVTQHLRKQIFSPLLCTIYCLNYFAKMLSGPQSYMESNSTSNWYSFQCNLQCWIQSGVEFCWVTQHLQKQIFSTLPCTVYCLNYFAKMLSGPQSYIKSNSASYWYSFQCNLLCRIQTGVEFCWVTQHLQKQICSTLLCTIYCINYFAKMLSVPQSYMESNSDIYSNAICYADFVEWLNTSKSRFVPLYYAQSII